jgi:hypothetical protein
VPWGHPSFQNDEEPDAGLIELFDGDSEFLYEVGTALRTPRFAVVRGWRSTRTRDLAVNTTPGRCFRQASDQVNNYSQFANNQFFVLLLTLDTKLRSANPGPESPGDIHSAAMRLFLTPRTAAIGNFISLEGTAGEGKKRRLRRFSAQERALLRCSAPGGGKATIPIPRRERYWQQRAPICEMA